MKIVIHLNTDNKAFGNGRYGEVVELILQALATKVAYGDRTGCLFNADLAAGRESA